MSPWLAVDDIQVCKHFQTGHCKFGVNCKKRHISENCLNADCLDKTCLKRHPKQCKYFSQIGSCRFGEECSYKHTLPSSHEHFSSQIQALEGRIGDMCKAIKVLEDKILEWENVNQCEKCDYKANSSTSLKTHMSKKHKSLLPLFLQKEKGLPPLTPSTIFQCQALRGRSCSHHLVLQFPLWMKVPQCVSGATALM